MQTAWHNWKDCEEQANVVEGKNDELNLFQWGIMLWLTNACLLRGSSVNCQYLSLDAFNPCCCWTCIRHCLVWTLLPNPLSCFSSFFLSVIDRLIYCYFASPKPYCLELNSLCSSVLRWCFPAGACLLAPGFSLGCSYCLFSSIMAALAYPALLGHYMCKENREERNSGIVCSNKISNESMARNIMIKTSNNSAQTPLWRTTSVVITESVHRVRTILNDQDFVLVV